MKSTQKFLQTQVDNLNCKVNLPNADGKKFILDYAYGGVALYIEFNNHGVCADVFNLGYVSKKELSGLINAFNLGISFVV